ncbi:DUF3352 domain-containing protein [Plectonema cf. radiosum LEGE 06105]|uniref:DUF3352 domain-containing protein n=1 Tax=Plectonema cf. radiosum LEGE 06105 TaxID=945769 RepID=A0A8J7F4M2_9CYAN|nr:DUF3352 domain-containing protein [Plectonema radiosum]MBE9214995.1 DUF3352 domain-containing protein [Plectonema cf. radiosum LEGE 06105]
MNRFISQKLLIRFLAASFIVLLLTGITGCNRLSQNSLNLLSQPSATVFVSKQAPIMVSMLVNPNRFDALDGEIKLSKLKTNLFANTGLDYQKDVQPWLGNQVTLAVTTDDIDRDLANGKQPGYLIALTTKDATQSREFIELLFSKRVLAGTSLVVEQYKGVKLIGDTPETGEIKKPLAATVVGDNFVLFANDAKILREAVNNLQAPGLSLASLDKYQQAIKQLGNKTQAVTFLNLPAVAKWQGLNLSSPLTYNNQLISLATKSPGLLAETSLLADSPIPSAEELSEKIAALSYIPPTSGLVIAGKDLSNLDNSNVGLFWQQTYSVISGDSGKNAASQITQPLNNLQKSWGINLKKDIFSWVKGEYAIALLPNTENKTLEWVFVTEKSSTTPSDISHLDEIAVQNGLTVSQINLNEQKIYAWTQLTTTGNKASNFSIQAKVLGAHTSKDNYEIFTSSIELMDEVLNNKENFFNDNHNFQKSIAAIPQPNQGYIFIDWTKSQNFIENQLPILKLVEIIGKPFFDKLQSLTISSYDSNSNLLKAGAVFLFN